MNPAPLLTIPPFPGARAPRFAAPGGTGGGDTAVLLAALAEHRVGGCYWGRQISGPERLDAANWPADADPWSLLDRAQFVRLPKNDPRALLALAAGVPTILVGEGSERAAGQSDAARLLEAHLTGWQWFSPFDGRTITPLEAIALCGQWRALIDANRRIHSVMGIAYWKKPTVSALLWAGGSVPYNRSLTDLPPGAAVALWRTRISGAQARALEAAAPPVIEIEDGFIRSQGLGADCVPPLSIIVDEEGAHFDPNTASGIERLLQEGDFSPELLVRARALREAVVAGGLSKYEKGSGEPLARPGGDRRHVLVPGQVEDDRAVTSGGALSSNLELLRRARAEVGPEAFLIYKPHPDVLAGHRRGRIPEHEMAALADRVETTTPIAELIAMADELHVNSSLAGFEALMRGKKATVHGAPFYAGWGLTVDRGPVPARRSVHRTIDELAAAALLLYPRYLDPKTGLPCSAEVLVDRLASGSLALPPRARAAVALRRSMGQIKRLLRAQR